MPAKANTRRLSGIINGLSYAEYVNRWTATQVYVTINSAGDAYITGNDGVRVVSGIIEDGYSDMFIEKLEKGLEWSKISKKNKIDAKKELGFFSSTAGGDENIALVFLSKDHGKHIHIVIKITDIQKRYNKMNVFLSPSETQRLIGIIKDVPATVEALREDEKKADLLK